MGSERRTLIGHTPALVARMGMDGTKMDWSAGRFLAKNPAIRYDDEDDEDGDNDDDMSLTAPASIVHSRLPSVPHVMSSLLDPTAGFLCQALPPCRYDLPSLAMGGHVETCTQSAHPRPLALS